MSKDFTTHYYDVDDNDVVNENNYIDTPRICMHCRNTGEQIAISAVSFVSDDDFADGVAFTTCQLCNATSMHYLDLPEGYGGFYKVVKSFPANVVPSLEFSSFISSKFPDFVKIYNQSLTAEDTDLDHLAGMGYRKSLEFLVTDYLIQYPVEGVKKDWITNPKTSLSQKIDKLKNPRIKDLAKAISYLGNDETHYSRQHPEYDIDAIKMFIRALVSDVENDLVYQEATKFLNKSKKT